MSEDVWRPLDIDTDDAIAEYDALHEGLPDWIADAFWEWVRDAVSVIRTFRDGSGRVKMLDEGLAETVSQTLRITLPNIRSTHVDASLGNKQLDAAVLTFKSYGHPLRIADALLALGPHTDAAELNDLLTRGKSALCVGTRAGRDGLTRRVPEGVQVALDSVIERSGRAGVRLAAAWESLYGLSPNPSEAYRQVILAVEDAVIPVVQPDNPVATYGTALRRLEEDNDWRLPMEREHKDAPSRNVVIGMLRMLWHGQHDRHGGQPTAPGNVSMDEATVAVGLGVTIVHWFTAGIVSRGSG